MKTGFKKLDKILGGGINEGEVTIIAGRPAKYKKTLAFNIACSFAKDFYRTMIFSTNLSKTLVQERINKICGNSDINNAEKVNIESYIGINDCSYLTPKYIEEQYKNMSKKLNGVNAIIVDCFNDILCDEWNELKQCNSDCKKINRSIVMNNLRKLARDKGVAIILCVNLNRDIETRKDNRPYINDLSKVIDGQCFPDNVLFIFDDNGWEKSEECEYKNLTVEVARNRTLECGFINYKFNATNFKLIEDEKDGE